MIAIIPALSLYAYHRGGSLLTLLNRIGSPLTVSTTTTIVMIAYPLNALYTQVKQTETMTE